MKTYKWLTLLVFVGMMLVVYGCSQKSSVSQSTLTDEQALKLAVMEVDSVADFSASDELSIDDDGMKDPEFDDLAGMSAAKFSLYKASVDSIYPVRWGRRISWSNVTRNYTVHMQGDTIAFVLITKTIPGEFWIGWGTRTPDTVIIQDTVKKSFTETVQRKVMFRRIARTDNPRENWIPVAITIVKGKTEDVNNFYIASLEISAPLRQYDTSFIDPLNHWFRLGLFRGSVPKFYAGDSIVVKLTLTSSDSSSEIAYLRHGIPGGRMERRRAKMDIGPVTGVPGNYSRVYSRSFRAKLPLGVLATRCNIIADVVSDGTINSTTLPFSNEFWGIPYIVVR